ncbi:hypothetical protein AB0K71_06100 [Streptomyces syringium]|uniref:hypothetical protein n=1 Tax=Streptomyces syringium TaxID=76729 RepID=UPI003431A9B0
MTDPSKTPGLSFSLAADGLHIVLRADQIRHDTITGLVAEWQETGTPDDVTSAIEDLAEACRHDREADPAEVDARVEDVEAAACMGAARLVISLADAVRLRAELDAVIEGRNRFGAPAVPHQRAEGGAAA